MDRLIITLLCTLCTLNTFAQSKKGFIITSDIPDLPEGIEVVLETAEGSNYDEVARAIVKDGKFEVVGRVTHPTLCTLSTNNYKLLYAMESKEEPTWTYTPIFVSNTEMVIKADKYKYLFSNLPISKHLRVTGGRAQEDFNDFNQRKNDSLTWMKQHPQSPLAIKMATEMVLNNRTLTKRQIEDITANIFACLDDYPRVQAYRRAVATAKAMAVGEALEDLSMYTQKNHLTSLLSAIPKDKVAFVCFWTTWRKSNQKLIPEFKKMIAKHPEVSFLCVADDKEDFLWQKFLEREQLLWPQYRLTKKGFKHFNEVYGQDATPFFAMLDPEGKIVRTSSYLAEMQKLLDKHAGKLTKQYEQKQKKKNVEQDDEGNDKKGKKKGELNDEGNDKKGKKKGELKDEGNEKKSKKDEQDDGDNDKKGKKKNEQKDKGKTKKDKKKA